MTSTNDGKDVKINQKSSQKGKTYYIELYKSLESRLSGDCSGEERTQCVGEAWRRIHSLCNHSAPSTHPHLLSWLQRHTARTVLQTEWPKSQEQHIVLTEAIDEFLQDCASATSKRNGVGPPWESQLQQWAEGFKKILPNPWGHPVLQALLGGQIPNDEEILEWLKQEHSVMFVTRLRQMGATKSCLDLALKLAATIRQRACTRATPDTGQPDDHRESTEPTSRDSTAFADVLRIEAGFTPDVWNFLMDIEFILLDKGNNRPSCIELAKQIPFREACPLVERLYSRLESSPQDKKLWKNAKEVAVLIAQVVIARCMLVPVCRGDVLIALYGCFRSVVHMMADEKLFASSVGLAALAATARHLHTMAAAAHKQLKGERTPFVCQLYVRAITAGMNELEKLKLGTEKEAEARATEQTLSSWFTHLGSLLSASKRLSCECVLTAFSVHPSPLMYEKVKGAPSLELIKDIQEPKLESTSEFGSWATDSHTQTNLVKTSETLNMKHSQKQANILSTAIFTEGEALGLEPELCNDLAVLLSGPRVKTLTWDMERDVLLENCRTYMERTHGGTRALTTELKYLNLDPSSFQHLPEEDDNEDDLYYGIEKGYEHLLETQEQVPEYPQLWQDPFIDSPSLSSDESIIVVRRRKKKKKRVPQEDPLKLDIETNSNKNNERSNSTERSKPTSRDHTPHHSQSNQDICDNKEKKPEEHSKEDTKLKKEKKQQKKKEKKEPKERKKREKSNTGLESKKVKRGKSSGGLAKLLGLKVARKTGGNKITNRNNGRKLHSISNDGIKVAKKTDENNIIDKMNAFTLHNTSSDSKPSQENNSVVFDGLFSMDDMKFRDTQSIIEDKTRNIVAYSEVNPPSLVPLALDVRNESIKLNTANKVSEDVKKNVKKLIHFRRQKLKEQIKIDSLLCNEKNLTDGSMLDSVSPKFVSVPELPTAFIARQNLDYPNVPKPQSIKDITKECNALKDVKPLQTHSLSKGSLKSIEKGAAESASQRAFEEFLKLQSYDAVNLLKASPLPQPVTKVSAVNQTKIEHLISESTKKRQPSIKLNKSAAQDFSQHSSSQKRYQKPSCNRDVPIPNDVYTNIITQPKPKGPSIMYDPTQKHFQIFLKELQQSINAGTNTKQKPENNWGNKITGTKIKQQKMADNVPNTFARRSYLHKSKQMENKMKTEEENRAKNATNGITDLDKMLHLQSSGQIVISRVNKNQVNKPADPLAVTSLTKTKPAKILQSHPNLISALQTKSTTTNIDANISSQSDSHPMCPNKGESPTTSTALSEKDQVDLLLLLRQKNKLNAGYFAQNKTNYNDSLHASCNTSNTIAMASKVKYQNSSLLQPPIQNLVVNSSKQIETSESKQTIRGSHQTTKSIPIKNELKTNLANTNSVIKQVSAEYIQFKVLQKDDQELYEINDMNFKESCNFLDLKSKKEVHEHVPKAVNYSSVIVDDYLGYHNNFQLTQPIQNLDKQVREDGNVLIQEPQSNLFIMGNIEIKESEKNRLNVMVCPSTQDKIGDKLDPITKASPVQIKTVDIEKKSVPKITSSLPTINKSQTIDPHKSDWESVLDDLLKHKTPSRGPKALDVALKKDSFEKHIPRNALTEIDTKKIARGENNQTSVKNDTVRNIAVNSQISKGFQTLNEPNTLNPIFVKKPNVENTQKFIKINSKEEDPFISGIHNSDYDLLDELMDEDLRQEIDDAYYPTDLYTSKEKDNLNASGTFTVTGNIEEKLVPSPPLSQFCSKKGLNTQNNIIKCNNPKSVILKIPKKSSSVVSSDSKPRVISNELIINTKVEKNTTAKKNNLKQNYTTNNNTTSKPRIKYDTKLLNSNLKNNLKNSEDLDNLPAAVLHMPDVSSKVITTSNLQKKYSENPTSCINVVDPGKVIIAPKFKATQNVMLVQSSTVLSFPPTTVQDMLVESNVYTVTPDPYNSSNTTPNKGLVNSTPNINQFISPVIVSNISGLAIETIPSISTKATDKDNNLGKSTTNTKDVTVSTMETNTKSAIHSSKIFGLVGNTNTKAKVDTKRNKVSSLPKLSSNIDNGTPKKTNVEDMNQGNERKVLSEVQEKLQHIPNEKSETKNRVIMNKNLFGNDLKSLESVELDNNLITSKKKIFESDLKSNESDKSNHKIIKNTNDLFDNNLNSHESVEHERLQRKRISIMNRQTSNISYREPIVLTYSPIKQIALINRNQNIEQSNKFETTSVNTSFDLSNKVSNLNQKSHRTIQNISMDKRSKCINEQEIKNESDTQNNLVQEITVEERITEGVIKKLPEKTITFDKKVINDGTSDEKKNITDTSCTKCQIENSEFKSHAYINIGENNNDNKKLPPITEKSEFKSHADKNIGENNKKQSPPITSALKQKFENSFKKNNRKNLSKIVENLSSKIGKVISAIQTTDISSEKQTTEMIMNKVSETKIIGDETDVQNKRIHCQNSSKRGMKDEKQIPVTFVEKSDGVISPHPCQITRSTSKIKQQLPISTENNRRDLKLNDKSKGLTNNTNANKVEGVHKSTSKITNSETDALLDQYRDQIHFEEIPRQSADDPLKRIIRIKLPNGSTFRATISGKLDVNVDSIFTDPQMKSILLNNTIKNKKCTLNLRQVTITDKLNSTEKTVVNEILYPKTISHASETINLISDDEDEQNDKGKEKSKDIFETEFGNYIVSPIDKEVFLKHQKRFSQKCTVNLERSEFVKKICAARACLRLKHSKLYTSEEIRKSEIVDDVSMNQKTDDDIIEIDDSSSDSLDVRESPKKNNNIRPKLSADLDVLRNSIIKGLRISNSDKTTDNSEPTIEEKTEPFKIAESEDVLRTSIKKGLRLSNSDGTTNNTEPIIVEDIRPIKTEETLDVFKTSIKQGLRLSNSEETTINPEPITIEDNRPIKIAESVTSIIKGLRLSNCDETNIIPGSIIVEDNEPTKIVESVDVLRTSIIKGLRLSNSDGKTINPEPIIVEDDRPINIAESVDVLQTSLIKGLQLSNSDGSTIYPEPIIVEDNKSVKIAESVDVLKSSTIRRLRLSNSHTTKINPKPIIVENNEPTKIAENADVLRTPTIKGLRLLNSAETTINPQPIIVEDKEPTKITKSLDVLRTSIIKGLRISNSNDTKPTIGEQKEPIEIVESVDITECKSNKETNLTVTEMKESINEKERSWMSNCFVKLVRCDDVLSIVDIPSPEEYLKKDFISDEVDCPLELSSVLKRSGSFSILNDYLLDDKVLVDDVLNTSVEDTNHTFCQSLYCYSDWFLTKASLHSIAIENSNPYSIFQHDSICLDDINDVSTDYDSDLDSNSSVTIASEDDMKQCILNNRVPTLVSILTNYIAQSSIIDFLKPLVIEKKSVLAPSLKRKIEHVSDHAITGSKISKRALSLNKRKQKEPDLVIISNNINEKENDKIENIPDGEVNYLETINKESIENIEKCQKICTQKALIYNKDQIHVSDTIQEGEYVNELMANLKDDLINSEKSSNNKHLCNVHNINLNVPKSPVRIESNENDICKYSIDNSISLRYAIQKFLNKEKEYIFYNTELNSKSKNPINERDGNAFANHEKDTDITKDTKENLKNNLVSSVYSESNYECRNKEKINAIKTSISVVNSEELIVANKFEKQILPNLSMDKFYDYDNDLQMSSPKSTTSSLNNITLIYSADSDIILRGSEYKDPKVGTCYLFPLRTYLKKGEENNVLNVFKIKEVEKSKNFINEKLLDEDHLSLDEDNLNVIIPKVTYSKEKNKCTSSMQHLNSYIRRNLKRKRDSLDSRYNEKRYRKGKNIDYPKLTVTAMEKSAYVKEFNRLIDYWNNVKFSFSQSYHKVENLDTCDLLKSWPIQGTIQAITTECRDENIHFLCDNDEAKIEYDPLHQSLADELASEYQESEYKSIEINENNFSMGFGEGSDRVIQSYVDRNTLPKISAAALSDVKHAQPFLPFEYRENYLKKINEDKIEVTKRYISYIRLKEKVRSFFKRTTLELNNDWILNNTKENKNCNNVYHNGNFPVDLDNLDFFGVPYFESIVQVVQVGQLPVSAAAQNPVTCDPRVTQVTDASPPQCSAENSPRDGSQASMKTEYTELTTADLSIPLVQEYERHNQTMNLLSQENHKLTFSDENIPIETEVNSIVKIEIAEEELENEEQNDNDENELHTAVANHTTNRNYTFDTNTVNSMDSHDALSFESFNNCNAYTQHDEENESNEKTDQIAHAMNAAGINTNTEPLTTDKTQTIGNILRDKSSDESGNVSQTSGDNYVKTASINAITLQQALAQILPPPLNRTNSSESNQQNANISQVLHIVQGKNSSVNQLTLVDNTQKSVINTSNPTPVMHIVQNKGSTTSSTTSAQQSSSFNGLSLVDGSNIQQGSNQLIHIVNAGNQKSTNAGQLLKRVNLLTNLSNVQGNTEQKMVQFVCKSADGKSIQLNAPHQRSMVLRLQPIETSTAQNTNCTKSSENQNDLNSNCNTTNSINSNEGVTSQQEIKSRSVYEENYAKFIQNSGKPPVLEKSTSLPKFNQAFGKQVFQDESQKVSDINENHSHLSTVNTASESSDCQPENSINMDQIGQMSSPPLLLRKPPAQITSQPQPSQPNLVQQIKQTITPMNLQTMHGGVIYTRQIPVNIGGGQTINLITVPSTELVDDSNQKQHVNQSDMEPSIIKIVQQNQTPSNTEVSTEENRNLASNDNQNNQPQPVLTQMRIKLPMLSKPSQMVSGTRVVRPSFFQIQRNVIGGANQPVYQQLVLTAAPPLGQQTIRLPQTHANRLIKVPSESNQTSPESQMSSSTLEQLREFDMVLEQVKERSTVQPNQITSGNTFNKIHTAPTDTPEATPSSNVGPSEPTQQVLYTIGNNASLNVAYVNRKTTVTTTPSVSTFVRSPDSSNINDSPSSSTQSQIPQSATSEAQTNDISSVQNQHKTSKLNSKSKSRPKSSSHPTSSVKINTVAPKPSTQKPFEDEQTTQRILYILAEYKEQVENSPDKDKPAPRRRSNPPSNPGSSKRKKSSSGSRRSGTRDISPVHGEDTCRTMGSEDSSCGTSQGDCTESCLDSHSPQDSPRKVVRKLTFEQETPSAPPRPQAQRNVIVADGQTITVARSNTGKPTTAVLMPANYILPVSMVKSGQQIAIVTNRGPKILTVGGGEGGGNAVLLQRLIGPGLKPVLARPGVRHVRLPAAALHNLQAFTLGQAATSLQPDSTAPVSTQNPPELVDTRATSSPWAEREGQDPKPEKQPSPETSEPWNLASSTEPHDYSYEEIVRTDNMDRTVLDAIPDRYSPDMEAQRIFDKMFDIDTKKSYVVDSQDDSPRCGYDIDASDCDDKAYHQVVHRKDGTPQRHHRLTHVSAAALRHRYAILEHELRLQKSLSEECEDLGVDSPSASELFPEAELLFSSSPAHEAPHHSHTPQPTLTQSSVPQPDIDDQIATDQLIGNEVPDEEDLNMALGLDSIVTVSGDGMQATITLDPQEFAKSHPNTTFHKEPTDESELQPFTIANVKGRHMTSTIFHASRAPATVLVTAPQTTVISQATPHGGVHNLKYPETPTNSQQNLPTVLVKDNGVSKFDTMLNDRELHLSHTASTIIHSSGNATQVIRRVCYDDDKNDPRFLDTNPIDDAKMTEDSRDATLESIADVDDDRSSPERNTEMFWESNSASEPSESRRPMDFSSDSDKCCKSPFEETNSTDSSGIGTHIMRLDSVIKDARGIERSGSADGSSADDTHPPLRTYPPKRMFHNTEGEMERSTSGKTRAGERSPDSMESRRRASNRGVVKRGCHCCNGSPAPKPKKSRPRKPTSDFN